MLTLMKTTTETKAAKTEAARAKVAALLAGGKKACEEDRTRGRGGRYASECKWCGCDDGCACTPEALCSCDYIRVSNLAKHFAK